MISLPYSGKVTQQQGGFHGGAIGAIADIAGGYAGLTQAPEGMEVTSVEYKINFLAAFEGGELRATGRDPCRQARDRDQRGGHARGRAGPGACLRGDAADAGAGAPNLLNTNTTFPMETF